MATKKKTTKKKTAKKKTAKKDEVQKLDQSDPNFLPVQYNMTEAAIAKLRKEYDPALIPDTEKKGDEGYLVVHEKTMAITKVRTAIEARRKDLKSDALAWGKLVDGKAKELTAIVEEIEGPWRELKVALDEKEAKEAEAEREKEILRIQVIEAKVEQLKSAAEGLLGLPVSRLKERLRIISDVVIDDSYGEFVEAAQYHKDNAVKVIDSAIAERETFEEQQAQLKVNQEAIAAAQKEITEKAAELEKTRLANEVEAQRLKDEAAQQVKAEKDRKDAEAAAEAAEEERKNKEIAESKAKEKQEAELLKRLPEDEKMRVYVAGLRSVDIPEVESEAMMTLLSVALKKLDDISKMIFDGTQGE